MASHSQSAHSYQNWINPNLPDLVRFARQKELQEMEANGLDLEDLTPWQNPCLHPFMASPRESQDSLPELVRFAREREEVLPKRSLPDDYLTPWDGLSHYESLYLCPHAEPLMPLRGRDFDVMVRFFNDDGVAEILEAK
ncbi:MAG: hypothetical protein ACO31I_14815 [Prochlorotrichaceae cyanobacterium]|jgi:hypothetical protein